MTPEEQSIYQDLQFNSIVFFKDFIERLTKNDDDTDDHISRELVILSVTSLQISLELALKALVLKKTGLINIIKDSNTSKTYPELLEDFQNNLLHVKKFELIKTFSKSHHLLSSLTDEDYEIITDFQRYRNGTAHFSFKFQEGDYFDLKYDITYFVVSILIKVLCSENEKPSEFLEYSLGSQYHNKLINYRPYISAMEKLAKEKSDKVFFCIICNNITYSQDDEYCYCCNFDGNHHTFRNCDYCKEKNSMIYDSLNLENNGFTTKGVCLNCQSDALIFVCPICETSYNLETDVYSKICNIDRCVNNE